MRWWARGRLAAGKACFGGGDEADVGALREMGKAVRVRMCTSLVHLLYCLPGAWMSPSPSSSRPASPARCKNGAQLRPPSARLVQPHPTPQYLSAGASI